jgi:galactofuranose transport system permease protein
VKLSGIMRSRQLPLITTAATFCLFFGVASFCYDGFFSARVATSLLSDNAFLGIAALGMTLVIFSGGIDLSVGAVVGFTTIFTATLLEKGFSPALVWLYALAIGAALGTFMGTLIHVFRLPAFLITLAGMFLARGAGFWISTDSIGIQHPLYARLADFELNVAPGMYLPARAIILLVVALVLYVVGHYTRFGRTVLAIGGNEQSALLMGLPVGRAKILVYTLNGVCAALAGIVATIYTGNGDSSRGTGLELDAIAVVVIGGTLLTGGRGHILGTVLGLLIFGTIQSAILFDGRLGSSWMRIVVGALLLAFILLQRFLLRGTGRRAGA